MVGTASVRIMLSLGPVVVGVVNLLHVQGYSAPCTISYNRVGLKFYNTKSVSYGAL